MPSVKRTITFMFYDITTTPEFFAQFLDDAVISNQFLQWVSEKLNTIFAPVLSAMDENSSPRTAPANLRTFLTSTIAAVVELGTEWIREVNRFAYAVRKIVKKDP